MKTSDYLLAVALAAAMLFVAALTVPQPSGTRLPGTSILIAGYPQDLPARVRGY
jgi:hypothetical protein